MRKVATNVEAAELSSKAMAAVESAVGPGGGVVILPVQQGDRQYMTVIVKGETFEEKLAFLQHGLEVMSAHLVYLYEQEHKTDPPLNSQGVGITPPPEILIAGKLAMAAVRHVAEGVLVVVHRSQLNEDGTSAGGVIAMVGDDSSPAEYEVLATFGPTLVDNWAKRTLEEIKTRSGPKQ